VQGGHTDPPLWGCESGDGGLAGILPGGAPGERADRYVAAAEDEIGFQSGGAVGAGGGIEGAGGVETTGEGKRAVGDGQGGRIGRRTGQPAGRHGIVQGKVAETGLVGGHVKIFTGGALPEPSFGWQFGGDAEGFVSAVALPGACELGLDTPLVGGIRQKRGRRIRTGTGGAGRGGDGTGVDQQAAFPDLVTVGDGPNNLRPFEGGGLIDAGAGRGDGCWDNRTRGWCGGARDGAGGCGCGRRHGQGERGGVGDCRSGRGRGRQCRSRERGRQGGCRRG